MSRWIQKPPLGAKLDRSHPLSQGIVGCWLMNEGGGDRIYDLSANANIGVLTGMAFPPSAVSGWNPGKSGYSLVFDRANDYIDFGSSFNFTSGAFSFSYWVYFYSLSTNIGGQGPVVIFKGRYNTSGYYHQYGTDGSINFFTCQSAATQNSATPAGTVVINKWYNLSITRNGASVRIFVNGADLTSTAASHVNPASSALNFAVGRYEVTNIFMGALISSLVVYNRALTAQEVFQLYTQPYANIIPQATRKYWLMPQLLFRRGMTARVGARL